MIIKVNRKNTMQAATVHSVSWKESHRSFCSADFVDLHTPARQKEYIERKMREGSRFFMLAEEEPIGIVSVNGSLIEDLYVLPEKQNMGCGTRLLRFAMRKCAGAPTLWILENNEKAARLYRRIGFMETGNIHAVTAGLNEIEFAYSKKCYAYLLRCADGSLYGGWTTDLDKRLKTHNSGKGAKYTRARLPVTLAYWEEYPDKRSAMRREWQLKHLSRAEKEALVFGFETAQSKRKERD
ncbi:MAG: GNAT family N-acetyltransferase [Clostridia bacterium]|nr:GNAT family N-acetyltransferase [Clostridia bacterium]